MGFRLPSLVSNNKQLIKLQSLLSRNQQGVPRGHITVYVGGGAEKRRHVVPLSYLSHPSFQDLLSLAEEEFGYNHPMGGLTIPCEEEAFTDLSCRLSSS